MLTPEEGKQRQSEILDLFSTMTADLLRIGVMFTKGQPVSPWAIAQCRQMLSKLETMNRDYVAPTDMGDYEDHEDCKKCIKDEARTYVLKISPKMQVPIEISDEPFKPPSANDLAQFCKTHGLPIYFRPAMLFQQRFNNLQAHQRRLIKMAGGEVNLRRALEELNSQQEQSEQTKVEFIDLDSIFLTPDSMPGQNSPTAAVDLRLADRPGDVAASKTVVSPHLRGRLGSVPLKDVDPRNHTHPTPKRNAPHDQ